VNVQKMKENADLTGDLVLAEAAYSLLATQGFADAHELIRRATLRADDGEVSLLAVLREDSDIWQALETALAQVSDMPATEFFSNPSHYAGRAPAVAAELANDYHTRLASLREGKGR
jgi:adenylosuccinate lyase